MFYIYLSLILIFLYFSVLLILDPNKFEPSIDHSKKNRFCQEIPSNAPLIDQLVCKNPYRKGKFLWFMIDGLAFSQVDHLAEEMQGKANLFKVNSQDFYRQSGALHEMYLTGKFSNNFVGDPILIDNLLLQMNQASHKLHFFGTPYPIAYLGGGPKTSIYFNQSYITIEDYPFQIICPSLDGMFYDGVRFPLPPEVLNDKEKLYKFLDEKIEEKHPNFSQCFEEKGLFPANTELNLLYYTAMIDNHNHAFSKENPNARKVTYGVEKYVIKLMKWIDENPDYALFVSSDHGGQDFFGEDSYCNHGCLKEGNQGIFFSYVKEFSTGKVKQETQEIDIFDIAPTVSQLIEGVNIPMFARGMPAVLGDDDILAFVALRSKEIQLLEYIRDFKSEENMFELASYKILQKIKNISEFKGLRNTSLYLEYKEENAKIINYVEDLKLKDNELYKFYPIACLIFFLIIYIWRHILLKKEFSPSENLTILMIIWINLYCDTFFAFYRYSPFEVTNKLTLYISLILLIFVVKYVNPDFNFLIEMSKVFKNIKNDKKNLEKELPVHLQEFENLAKSVHINNKKNEKNQRYFFLLIIFSIFSLFMLYTEYYVDMKKFQSLWEKSQCLDFMNYPVFIYTLFRMIEKENAHWHYTDTKSKNQMNIAQILKKYYAVIILLMGLYDLKRPRNFVNQDWSQQYLCRGVYSLLIIHIFWIFYNRDRAYDKDLGKKKQISVFNEIISNIKIPIIAYLFFLNDEMDRIILFFYMIPFYECATKLYHRIHSPIVKLFIVSIIMKAPDIFHVICKGTMTFDISLPAGNKTIGSYQDEFPIFTGVLFGTHKLQQYMISAVFLLDILGKETLNNHEETLIIYQMAFSKFIFCNLPLWYYVFSKQQSFYLIIFMFCMGKAMLVVLMYILILVLKISSYLNNRKNSKE